MLGGRQLSHGVGPPPSKPFGTGTPVEGAEIRAIPINRAPHSGFDAGFADGFQRFSIEGWVGTAPVVRAYVAAAVLWRQDGCLEAAGHLEQEFVVAPLERLPAALVDELKAIGLAIVDCEVGERPHPLLDVYRAVGLVEGARRDAELAVGRRFKEAHPDTWLHIDGALGRFASVAGADRVLGVIKSHETQFLAGVDLEVALTLPEGHRTTVFQRTGAGGDPVYSWYLRLWDRSDHDILHGLIRLERPPLDDVVRQASDVSAQLMAERAPISSGDARWDRVLYPIHEVEVFLRARAGGWL